jgi:outer membrane protein OmpA-like peptidoglycan-associated protein
MKKIFRLIVTAVILIIATPEVSAQNIKLQVAQSYYDQFDFKNASAIYYDILSNPKFAKDSTTLRLAADCEMKLYNYDKAEVLLDTLCAQPKAKKTDLHNLARVQTIRGKYPEALETYKKILLLDPTDDLAIEYAATPNFDNRLMRDSSLYEVKNSGVNSDKSDFAPAFYTNGKIIFASARGEGPGSTRSYVWNEQPYLNNYIAKIGADSSLSGASVMGSDINSRYHEGTVAYSPSDNMLYFTRNNYLKGNLQKAKSGRLYLGIYSGSAASGDLSELTAFPFNDREYSLQHPTLSKDGKKIYFSSNMPGGRGGMDLYYSEKKGEAWTEPKNLGKINSAGDEVFPYLSNDSTLYFSSNGRLGLGGLDLFFVKFDKDSLVQNMGYPANTKHDDFGLVLFPDENLGYFCSNRPGGKGDDDIYELRMTPPDSVKISGRVVDIATLQPLKNALVTITNTDGSVVQVMTDNEGDYTLMAPYQKVIQLEGEKKDYEKGMAELNTNPRITSYFAPEIKLKKIDFLAMGKVLYDADGTPAEGAKLRLKDDKGNIIDSLTVGVDGTYRFSLDDNKKYTLEAYKTEYVLLAKDFNTGDYPNRSVNNDFRLFKLEKGTVVRLDNIYYDYGKSDIRPDAGLELNKLVRILQDNPTMKIELSSHTDARGGDAYNLKLSDARANSAVKYIISQGIEGGRLVAKGYGETKLLNRCGNDVKCSDEEHQFNRRTEFKILEI